LLAQRAEQTAAQAAELRRIERDLHDGAQARLAAAGLSITIAERLLRTDPDQPPGPRCSGLPEPIQSSSVAHQTEHGTKNNLTHT
jgi:hypothetical protein